MNPTARANRTETLNLVPSQLTERIQATHPARDYWGESPLPAGWRRALPLALIVLFVCVGAFAMHWRMSYKVAVGLVVATLAVVALRRVE